MKLFDTNYLLRFILNDVQEQADIVSGELEHAPQGSIVLADPVIVEVVFALEKIYQKPRPFIVDALHMLLAYPVFEYAKQVFPMALALYRRHASISFVDAYLIALGQHTDVEICSFDKKLKKIYHRDEV